LETEGYRWVPVGGISNNSGAIEIGADPAESLNERITNAIDAVLEREWLEHHYQEPQPNTPREAAERWFKIPKGRFSNLSPVDRRKLAQHIRVTLLESNVENSPTVLVADKATGQHWSDFPKTLLSLHRDNKIDKYFLMGAYGQGGAAVYAFSEYTIIVSRRCPTLLDPGQVDEVGWTIVRYNPLDVEHKTGRYEYLVTPEGAIPHFDAALAPEQFEPGTQIRMIQYQLPRHFTIFTAPRGSLWALANMVLYDPVLPFLIGDERFIRYKKLQNLSAVQRTRVIIGNANRLREKAGPKARTEAEEEEKEEEEELRYDQEHTIDLGENGFVTVRYWIFNFSKSKTSPVDAFSDADSAIAVTLNGQRQAKFERTYFRTHLNLPIMKDYMLVQIDCDRLSKSGKKALFSSTRDRIRQGPFLDSLLAEMNDIISKDPHVRAIAAELQEAALKSASTEQNLRLSRQLEELINEWEVKGKTIEAGYQMLRDEEGTLTILRLKRKEEVEVEEQQEEEEKPPPPPREWKGKYFPTEFDFAATSDPLRIPLGKRYTLLFRSNAQDDCLTREHDRGEIHISINPGLLIERSRGQMRSGRIAIRLITAETASPDAKVQITATLSFPGRTPLVATRESIFVKPRKGAKKPTEVEGRPKYQIVPVVKENDHWKTDQGEPVPLNWNEESVADVSPTGKIILIYVSMSNRDYVDAIHRRSLSEETIHRYSDRYKVAIAFHAYLQNRQVTEMVETLKTSPLEQTLLAELQRAVRTVIFTTFVAPEQEILSRA